MDLYERTAYTMIKVEEAFDDNAWVKYSDHLEAIKELEKQAEKDYNECEDALVAKEDAEEALKNHEEFHEQSLKDWIISNEGYEKEIAELGEKLSNSFQVLLDTEKECDYLQAKLDELMLEYCPEDMTEEQIENWGNHQKSVKLENQDG